MKNFEQTDKFFFKKKRIILPVILISVFSITLLSVISIFLYRKIQYRINNKPSISKIKKQWQDYDYAGVFETSSKLNEEKVLNNTVLIYRGYSAYYLAVSETESNLAQKYIDISIESLRLALMNAKQKTIPQINYMLGKAYFYKNIICSYYYYSDLVVKYLENARGLGYKADDIAEYLGISYGQIGKHYESIACFSESLLIRESDSLLLSIAEQYYKLHQISACKQYLFQVTSNSKDDTLLLKAQTLLAKIYTEEEKYDEAKALYLSILDKNQNSADAHYGLGLIYEKTGDLVKARAWWRKTLKIDSTYEDAIKKMYR